MNYLKIFILLSTLFVETAFPQSHPTGPDGYELEDKSKKCEVESKEIFEREKKILKMENIKKMSFETYLDQKILTLRLESLNKVGPLISYSECNCTKESKKEFKKLLDAHQHLFKFCDKATYNSHIKLIPKLEEIWKYYEFVE